MNIINKKQCYNCYSSRNVEYRCDLCIREYTRLCEKCINKIEYVRCEQCKKLFCKECWLIGIDRHPYCLDCIEKHGPLSNI